MKSGAPAHAEEYWSHKWYGGSRDVVVGRMRHSARLATSHRAVNNNGRLVLHEDAGHESHMIAQPGRPVRHLSRPDEAWDAGPSSFWRTPTEAR